MSRIRKASSQCAWDPMSEDYDNSNYELQYPDDSMSELVKLDHCRLYVTNIPKGLNDDGLRSAFSKYGTLTELFVSKDPTRRYGLVSFETAAEARHAMMKLNKTEPLRLNISIAHEKGSRKDSNVTRGSNIERVKERDSTARERSNKNDDILSYSTEKNRKTDMFNGDKAIIDEVPDIDESMVDPELQVEFEKLRMESLKLQQQELACKKRMLIKQAERRSLASNQASNRCVLPDGKVVITNVSDGGNRREAEGSFGAAAGDSNLRDCACTRQSWERSSEGSCATSISEFCSDRTFKRRPEFKDKSTEYLKFPKDKKPDYKSSQLKVSDAASKKSVTSKATDLTSKKSGCSKYTDTVVKIDSKKTYETKKLAKNKSDATSDLKYSYFYDDEDDADETNRLIHLRNTDYADIVDEQLKIVVARAGYPKAKMRLRQMAMFQRCLAEVTELQIKEGSIKRHPCFLDNYLNRGAIVCICKDFYTRDWMVSISLGLQERMSINLILLKAKLKRICLAVLKVPPPSWPTTVQDTFKLIQYFNPTLKTDLWKIYSQTTSDGVETTSFLIDRVSGEIIRGPSFVNVVDYNEIEFELTGFTEIYYKCLLPQLGDDLSSVASRVRLMEEIKSENVTPTKSFAVDVSHQKPKEKQKTEDEVQDQLIEQREREASQSQHNLNDEKLELEKSLPKEVLKKLKDVEYISDSNQIVNWSDETNYSDQDTEKNKTAEYTQDEREKVISTSGVAVSEKTESYIESHDNLTISRNSNLNIDSNRGIAYHRRTNYLHVEPELKIAITLEGYPQDKLEGSHIRRLKHLFKEYFHRDMKNQRFTNLIIPKFQDIYLSNGAVIYICDSLETKDYLTEIMPKYINSTGLKLTFRDIRNLVRYTRIVMRLPKQYAHVESVEILLKLQAAYPGLKPSCWKYYSDVAGKQKRQYGVDPESLEVIKSPDFDPTYEGQKIIFRIIDRQKRDVSFEETVNQDFGDEDSEVKKMRGNLLKKMYVPINTDILKCPLTKIRTSHYSDLIADDLKLYVAPVNYPETRIDESLFYSFKRNLEGIVLEGLENDTLNENSIPKFYDMYLFDGVIFIICQNMESRQWIEENLKSLNSKLYIQLKSTEFRGAVGIISMCVKTDKDTDEVIGILQKQNPRLRTKFWRKISAVKMKNKLDVVLQIDKLSALVMTGQGFNKFIDGSPVQFKLGHLQSLLKPKASLEEMSKLYAKSLEKKSSANSLHKTRSKVSMQGPKDKSYDEIVQELKKEYPALKVDDWNVLSMQEKVNHKVCNLEIDETSAKVIEKEDFKLTMGKEQLFFYNDARPQASAVEELPAQKLSQPVESGSPRSVETKVPSGNEDLRKMILKIPVNILPDNKDDLSIIFDLLEDKNPGLNTELWKVYNHTPYPSDGKFTIFADRQSVSVIEGKNFDPNIGGEKLKFYF